MKLAAPGNAFCKPLLPELYEPVLTNIGDGLMVLRGFEREGEAAGVAVRCGSNKRATDEFCGGLSGGLGEPPPGNLATAQGLTHAPGTLRDTARGRTCPSCGIRPLRA